MKKLILCNHLSPGDIVMLTAALRDLHTCYPNQYLTDTRTSCPDLWDNNPYLTPLNDHQPDVERIECDYPLINESNEAPYHCLHGFIDFLNQRLGLHIRPTAFRGDIHLSDKEKSWYSQVHELTGEDTPFWIVVAGGKFDITIKWWQTERYQQIIDHFRGKIQFVQVGERGHHHPKLEGVIDLRGRTELRQLVRLVYHAQGVLCGVTAAMHLAAAVETKNGSPAARPCVVIAGGREPVNWEAYPHHQFMHTIGQLPCCARGGCWRARTVPLGDGDERDRPDRVCIDVVNNLPRCMDMITPADVIRRIEKYFDGRIVNYLTTEEAAAASKAVAATAGNVFPEASPRARLAQPDRVKTVLLQQASGEHIKLLDLSDHLHASYAARHNLTFTSIRGSVQSERPPVWDKVVLIRMMLELDFDLIVWLDADTLILRPEVDVRQALPDGAPIGMCRHPLPWETQPWHYNAGVILVRNTHAARSFFEEIGRGGQEEHPWQEQARMNELSQRQPELVQRIDDRWNCTSGVNPVRRPVIRGWHGQGPRAVALMKAAVAACRKSERPNPLNRRA